MKRTKKEFIPIITTLMDEDFYKLTMLQAFLHSMPSAEAEYAVAIRNHPEYPLSELIDDIDEQLDWLCTLRFTQVELDYLRNSVPYFKPDFIDFLEGFQLRRRFIKVGVDKNNPELIDIRTKGPIVQTSPFEIYTMGIVNELYFRRFNKEEAYAEGKRRMKEKINDLMTFIDLPDNRKVNPFEFFDFGTRRRFSREWQEMVVSTLAQNLPDQFRGTSNIDLARRYSLRPIGTMAHEYLQAFQGHNVRLRDFQKAALENWVKEYRGDLGIALTDVVGMRAFLNDFDLYFVKLFDGLRHDSGDPFVWARMALDHYKKLGVSTFDKRLVFSDGLTIKKATELYSEFGNFIRMGFGIGTSLTNDMGYTPLQIVMKLISINGQPTAKLPDTAGKTASVDQDFINYLGNVVFPFERGF